ncbi:MAG: phosphoribosylformylglycinamidine synthase subunit PurL [Planctomycetales bacterium]|nr:phosphoribosylformylglycinamidine synthase subunit PurL [Planctomycetales bacterium]
MLWQVDIYPKEVDREAQRIADEAAELGICDGLKIHAAHGYLVEGNIDNDRATALATQLLADTVVERTLVAQVGDASLSQSPNGTANLVYVLPKPGVMDPVAQSAQSAMQDYGCEIDAVRTFHKYWLGDLNDQQLKLICGKILANDSVDQVVVGPLELDRLQFGSSYALNIKTVPIRELDDPQLEQLSKTGQLYLTLVEMQTIQKFFQDLGRDPTDIELESLAQTWSEHCSHKTLAGRIAYTDENGSRQFNNMLKETIFAATQQIRKELGDNDWCVGVFEDNAGIVRFDDDYNVVFKVETHNHPSALEQYGGANTGIGGVIRDPMGTGLGAKPVCNTDVFCFAPPETSLEDLPPGVLHPRRVMKGVVSGVRDYGNRMGIPTVNGAIYFDERYLGNPLVYCGNVGLIPKDKSFKKVQEGDFIVSIGGRTGRDGIHGATFSSAELTSDSEHLSGGAVQIGNAITEKMVMDVLLAARDRDLFTAVTDCGAGGFSSAVGEMGEKIGAEVWLDKAPVKYEGLSYTEVWISEAQERMVFSVPESKWPDFETLCRSEGVEATIIGRFVGSGRLQLKYDGEVVGDLPMEFLHDGRPPVIREATYDSVETTSLEAPARSAEENKTDLLSILASLNVASKEWVIRQYDHEVQGGSVIKPLVGIENDGPSDAAVVRPVLSSRQGVVIACGMNPRFGDFDTYHMAASAIDEAIRNCVAVGADPTRIAILDNFCWGYTDRPETLGSLVRAALACHDVAVALKTPFISGKDSLNNEFSYDDENGRHTISIPPSLLISAMGQVSDVAKCVTMDLKQTGNRLYQIGATKDEFGGSHYSLVNNLTGGNVPTLDLEVAKKTYSAVHAAIVKGFVRSCHDLSEGGLAVALAEMAFAGNLGIEVSLDQLDVSSIDAANQQTALLFAESNSRFIVEVPEKHADAFENQMTGVPCQLIGSVTDSNEMIVKYSGETLLAASLSILKEAWQSPLAW